MKGYVLCYPSSSNALTFHSFHNSWEDVKTTMRDYEKGYRFNWVILEGSRPA